MSNNLIIIKNLIKGFINKLQVATINMNFSVNENVIKKTTKEHEELNKSSPTKEHNRRVVRHISIILFKWIYCQ